MMKKYVNACKFWAGLFSSGKKKYIWDTPATLHFGDWIAPDVPQMSQWQGRAKWTATASLKNTSGLVAQIAELLGETEDAKTYRELSENVADAYISVFTTYENDLNLPGEYTKEIDLDGKHFVTSGLGVSGMTIEDGVAVLFILDTF